MIQMIFTCIIRETDRKRTSNHHNWKRWTALPMALSFCCLAAKANSWQEVHRTDQLIVYAREHSGTLIKEVRAVAHFDIPNSAIKKVIEDTDSYCQFMPYTKESKLLSKTGSTRLGYMLLSPPLVGPRDFTIRIEDSTVHDKDGKTVYSSSWHTANSEGPPEKSGIKRVEIDEGSWKLESDGENENCTKVTYTLFTDAGGGLPPFLINLANRKSLPQLFEALRKRIAATSCCEAQGTGSMSTGSRPAGLKAQ
jgi:hypothetical protein